MCGKMVISKVMSVGKCRLALFYAQMEVIVMPYRPRTPCRHPGCPALVPYGSAYCDAHKPLHPEAVRSAGSRGYTSKWRRVSKAYLRAHPLCAKCGRPATVVDHIRPHRGDKVLFWDKSNWQSLCKPCHDRKTGEEDSRPMFRY